MSPTPRSTSTTNAATGGRAMIRDLGASAGMPASFDVRTAFDFAVSLASEVGQHDELPSEDRRWLEKARAALPDRVRPAIDDETCIMGAGLIIDRPDVSDAASYVRSLGASTGTEFAQIVLADNLRHHEQSAVVQAAIDGDREAVERMLADWPEQKRAWLRRLLDDADGMLGEVHDAMSAWLPMYAEIEPRVKSIIERDAEARAPELRTLRPSEVIERATNGIRWLSEPGVRRVILAPSYLVRPYNFTFNGPDWRLFIYPVGDSALEPHDPLAPPASVLRLHRALGDDTRLRILRLLRDRDWYLTEIAERLELSKPTIKHHLAQLRAAGLVTLIEEGGLSYYSLRRDRLEDASADLLRYLS
jgi:DNA-binding transcriptional ArsR family regulator